MISALCNPGCLTLLGYVSRNDESEERMVGQSNPPKSDSGNSRCIIVVIVLLVLVLVAVFVLIALTLTRPDQKVGL